MTVPMAAIWIRIFLMHVWMPDSHGTVASHVAKGGQLLWAPVDLVYCDYPYGEHPQKGIYTMEIPEAAIGGQTLHWSEHIRTAAQLQKMCWPRTTAMAERCWSGEGDYADFCRRLEAIFPVFGEMGIAATPSQGWDPDPEEAARQVADFHKQFDSENENIDFAGLLTQI